MKNTNLAEQPSAETVMLPSVATSPEKPLKQTKFFGLKLSGKKSKILGGLMIVVIILAAFYIWTSVKEVWTPKGASPSVEAVQVELGDVKTEPGVKGTKLKTEVWFTNNTNKDLWFMDYNMTMQDSSNNYREPERFVSDFMGQLVLKANSKANIHFEYSIPAGKHPVALIFNSQGFPKQYALPLTGLVSQDCCIIPSVTPTVTVTKTPASELHQSEQASLTTAINDFMANKGNVLVSSGVGKVAFKLPEIHTVNDYSVTLPTPEPGVESYVPGKECFKFSDAKGTVSVDQEYCAYERIDYTIYSKEKLMSMRDGFDIYYNVFPDPGSDYNVNADSTYTEEKISLNGKEAVLRKYNYVSSSSGTHYTDYYYVIPLANNNIVTVVYSMSGTANDGTLTRPTEWNVFNYILTTIKVK